MAVACESSTRDEGSGGAAAGSGGTAGSGGSGGEATMCCAEDFECPRQPGDGTPEPECVNEVCKLRPDVSTEQCWRDDDCPYGACNGATICGCEGMCFAPDEPGACDPPPAGCCIFDDAACTEPGAGECIGGLCEGAPPAGMCWRDSDCPEEQFCSGSYACPIGHACGPKSSGCTNMLGTCG
jgi:hypothetical protein